MTAKTVIPRIFTIKVQHKTFPEIIPITFYVFKDPTRPFTLLSYPALDPLGIVKFKIPNETSSYAAIDTITNTTEAKQVTFSTPLHTSTPNKKKVSKAQKLKSILHPIHTFQDHPQLSPFPDHKGQNITPSQEHSCPVGP